jgi:hypothetical protein
MKELESLDAAFVIDTFLLLLIGIGPKIARKYSEIVWLPMGRTASTSTNADVLTGLPNTYAPAASAADTGIDLIAESISLGSHDGDSLSPARPWDR